MRHEKILSLLALACLGLVAACDAPPTSPEAGAVDPDAVDAGPQLGILDGNGRAGIVLTGPASDAGPHVKAFDASTNQTVHSFFAFAPSFTGGVRVALGDVNGDGLADMVTAAGAGGGPHVKVFDGDTGNETRSFFAFAPSFTGGVFVSAGDVDGDGFADIVTGAGAGGGPHVKVFSGATGAELMSFFAFAGSFAGGVRVASGDVNGDGLADVVTAAGAGGGPHVKVFDGATGNELMSFFAYAASFTGGVFVGSGDVNGDGLADIVTGAGAGGGPHVKVFDGATGGELSSFFAYAPQFTGGVTVSAGDVNDDGHADIITGAGPGGGPHVKVFDGATGQESSSFFAYDAAFQGGVFVAGGHPGEGGFIRIIDELVAAAEEAVSQGTLVGDGPGSTGPGRLNAWMSMLRGVRAKLHRGDVNGACANLFNTHRRADGAPRPPDFVDGPAAQGLADGIRELGEDLGCGFPGPAR